MQWNFWKFLRSLVIVLFLVWLIAGFAVPGPDFDWTPWDTTEEVALAENEVKLDENAAKLAENEVKLAEIAAKQAELAQALSNAAVATPEGSPVVIGVPTGGDIDGSYPASQTVPAQTGTQVPTWTGQYGDASRTGVEEADSYPLYPFSAYLVIAAEFNGIPDAVHMIWVQSETEKMADFVNAEVIPAKQGTPLENVYKDGVLLTAFKASVQGRESLPFYLWTLSADGTITPGLPATSK